MLKASAFLLRIDRLILGYYVLRVAEKDIGAAADILLRASTPAAFSADGKAVISVFDISRVRELLDGQVEYTVSPLCGLSGVILRSRKRYGVIIGLILSLLVGALTLGMVWDVRIEGDEVKAAYVIEELRAAGFSVGSRWSVANLSEIEARVLASSERIGWINVNRRGTVAYVEVRERSTHDPVEKPSGYANVVAKFDATVEEITVKQGSAAVVPGESVKAGELLISGIGAGGELCYAEGEVRARTSESVEVFVPNTETVKEYGEERLCSVRIEIFGFSINIYKNYGNSEDKCVIIEKTKEFSLPGGVRLPFSIVSEYKTEYTEKTQTLTQSQMISLASYRLRVKTVAALADADLIRISTSGELTDGGYVMRSDIIAVRDISKVSVFEVSGQ